MRSKILVVLGFALASASCSHSWSTDPYPTAPPPPVATPSATAKAPGVDGGHAYSGLGATSISPEIIAKFAPPPLDPKVSSRIQSILDIRGSGGGLVSSDGKRVVFTWRITGTSQVWRQDGPMQFPVQLTGGEDNTTALALSHDDKWIVVSRDKGGAENPGLYLLSIDGGPLVEIQRKAGAQAALGFVADDDRSIYFTANDVDPASYALYRWDMATHQREAVLGEPGLWQVLDHQGTHVLLAKALGNTHIEIWDLELTQKKLTPVLGQNEDEDYDARSGAQPGTLLVKTNKLGDFQRLYRFASGQLTPLTPDLKHDVSGFNIDHGRSRIAYVVNEDGYDRLHLLDAKTEKPLALPPLPDAGAAQTFGGTFNANGRFMSIGYDSANRPQTIVVWDWKAKKLVSWRVGSAPEIDLKHFAKESLETYPARDGTKIPMFVYRPAACATADKPCPVVVYFHGGPESQTQAGFSPYAQLYVDAGFIFVEPNVRGSSGYGKAWLHSDDGPRRLAVITDIEDIATFIRGNWGRNGVAPRIGVAGGSYGGYSTLMAMTYFAGAYDAGVSEVGISNLVTFLMNTAPYRRILRTSEYGDPVKDHDALVKLSPVTYVDRVKAPLMLMQGVNDPRVPVNEAIQLHQALEARGVASSLILFPDAGHGTSKRGDQVLAIGHTLAFFEKHLK